MNDASPVEFPGSRSTPVDATDEQLSAESGSGVGRPALQPVGELLDRHWEAAFAYARLCAGGPRPAECSPPPPSPGSSASACARTGRPPPGGPNCSSPCAGSRRGATTTDANMLHPELGTEAGDGTGRRPAAAAENRRTLSGAFQRLPESARCLLWTRRPRRNPSPYPPGCWAWTRRAPASNWPGPVSGCARSASRCTANSPPTGVPALSAAAGRDLPARRRRHRPRSARALERCRHCRDTADQLDRFNDGLGAALAEAVLGWGGPRLSGGTRARARRPGRGADAARAGPGRFFGSVPQTPAPAFPGENFAPFTPASAVLHARRPARRPPHPAPGTGPPRLAQVRPQGAPPEPPAVPPAAISPRPSSPSAGWSCCRWSCGPPRLLGRRPAGRRRPAPPSPAPARASRRPTRPGSKPATPSRAPCADGCTTSTPASASASSARRPSRARRPTSPPAPRTRTSSGRTNPKACCAARTPPTCAWTPTSATRWGWPPARPPPSPTTRTSATTSPSRAPSCPAGTRTWHSLPPPPTRRVRWS